MEHVVGGGPVVGVVGGSGGVGASSLAAALARAAPGAVLVDLDVDGGGIDVGLGLEAAPGARWSGLQVAGGALDAGALRAALPRWGGVPVLAADVRELPVAAVEQVLAAAARTGPVVLDLPRRDCAERTAAVPACDLVVLLARADVAGVVSAHGVAEALRRCVGRDDPPGGIAAVVRRGPVPAGQVATGVGLRLLGAVPRLRGGVDPVSLPRVLRRVAAGVMAGVTAGTAAGVAAGAMPGAAGGVPR